MSYRYEGWTEITLGELCKRGGGNIQTGPFGSQLHSSDYVEVGVPSIMPKNISVDQISTVDIAQISFKDAKRLSKYLLKKGDIIYSRRGDVEKCALITEREEGWLCGTGCLRIRLGKNLDILPRYVHAYLSSPESREWMVRHAIGATMPNLNTSILNAVTIRIPPKEQLDIIASVWTNLGEKITLNRQINQTLEAMAQALFKTWFVDFEPVRAKVAALETGEDPTHAAMRAISGKTDDELSTLQTTNPAAYDQLHTTATLFPAAFVESELGLVPEGWEVKPFGETITLIGGGTPKRSNVEFWNGTIPWFSIKDIPDSSDIFVVDTDEKITDAGLNGSSTRLLKKGTVIITARGTVGKIAVVGTPMAMNQSCYGVVIKTFSLQF